MPDLNDIISLKDKEIADIKYSLADVFQRIRDLTQEINQDNVDTKKRQISELATNTIYDLRMDLFIENDSDKIIELPTANHSNR